MSVPQKADHNILPQLITSKRCLSCDVCCRFPDENSPLAPYFTAEEIKKAVAHGIAPERFSNPEGCKIGLSPHPHGEGYICPAFDPATSECRIYENRPLDCQIYPLALMWDRSGTTVLLGYDRKCPFIKETLFEDSPQVYSRTIASLLESDETIRTLQSYPGLIGAHQEDVMILQALPRLSRALVPPSSAAGIPTISQPSLESLGLTLLADTDRPLFDSARRWMKTELSNYSWPALMIWKDFFKYYWTIIDRQLCLFAKSADGLYMPLPPIGEFMTEPAVLRCFEIMGAVNHNSAVSRIEDLDAGQIPLFESMNFIIKPKEQEYLFDREQLVRLAGDEYKTKRWAYNRFVRENNGEKIMLSSYRFSDLDDCMDLHARWKIQRLRKTNPKDCKTEPGMDGMLLEDSSSAHRRALEDFESLDLVGRVVRLNGTIAAYTFGYHLKSDIFCILLEVADFEIAGLGAYLFREFCREAKEYTAIHAMGDSGLERLRKAKLSYRPSKILTSYIATHRI